MASTLGVYNPYFYANEALIHLEKALGMAGRIHRGFDEERRSFGKGEYINIRKPSTFTVQDAPGTAEELTTETVQIRLNNWKEVKFKLTDKELAYTGERIINDHIRPAAYALGDWVDTQLSGEYVNIPWFYDIADAPASTAVADVTGPHKVLFDNAVPLWDEQNMHYMVGGALQQGLLGLAAFTQHQGAGETGVNAQRRGQIGMRYGLNVFANQNVQTHTAGVCADATGALTADVAKGATSIAVDAMTGSGTFKAGDSLVIAGSTQRYVITADVTLGAGGDGTLAIFPAAVQAYSDNDVVTARVDSHVANLAFHRNAFAIAFAKLSMMGNELGAKIATVQDPITGLALRSRVYYVGNSSEVHVALDILCGYKTLDPNLAVRACGVVV